MSSDNKKRLVTPPGFAKWAWLNKPKEPYKDESGRSKGDPKYQIDVCFSADDPAWKAWAGEVKRVIDAMPVQTNKNTGQPLPKQMPIKRELDNNDQPTGRFYVTFKTSEKFKPGVFDKYGQPMENVLVGNESKVRVAYLANEYKEFGGGINFYLNAVQVLDLVEVKPQSASAYGFEVEAAPAGKAPSPSEDDLPF